MATLLQDILTENFVELEIITKQTQSNSISRVETEPRDIHQIKINHNITISAQTEHLEIILEIALNTSHLHIIDI